MRTNGNGQKVSRYKFAHFAIGLLCLLLGKFASGETCEGDQIVIPDPGHLASVASAAMRGISHAQAQLGVAYMKGSGIGADQTKALSLLTKSAEEGDSEGQYLLSEYYVINGKSDEDFTKAAQWLKRSAAQDCLPAVFYLGLLTENGKGVVKNVAEGFQMISKAAEGGYSQAQWWLGTMLVTGKGVEKDAEAGFKWTKKAADSGDSVGQIMLANFYLLGTGTPADSNKAHTLLESVYAKKDEQAPMAAFYLGWMYMEGRGVSVDFVKSFKWMIVAANSHVSDSEARLKTLAEHLPRRKLSIACDVYMDPILSANGAKEYVHAKEGEIIAMLSPHAFSEEVYFANRRLVGFISKTCLDPN